MTLGDSLPPLAAVKTLTHAPTEAATMTFSPAQRTVSEIIRGQSGRANLKAAATMTFSPAQRTVSEIIRGQSGRANLKAARTIPADPLSVETAAEPGGGIGGAALAVT